MIKKTKSTSHDGLFKKIMEEGAAVQEFLEYYRPRNVKELIDLSKVKVKNESYVEGNLKKRSDDPGLSSNRFVERV